MITRLVDDLRDAMPQWDPVFLRTIEGFGELMQDAAGRTRPRNRGLRAAEALAPQVNRDRFGGQIPRFEQLLIVEPGDRADGIGREQGGLEPERVYRFGDEQGAGLGVRERGGIRAVGSLKAVAGELVARRALDDAAVGHGGSIAKPFRTDHQRVGWEWTEAERVGINPIAALAHQQCVAKEITEPAKPASAAPRGR